MSVRAILPALVAAVLVASGAELAGASVGPVLDDRTVSDAVVAPDETPLPEAFDPGPVAPDVAEAEASAEAIKSGDEVPVDELTTETTTVTALPDGGFRADISALPQRTEQGGEWVDLDASLVRRAEGIEPRAAVNDLTLSDGGGVGAAVATFSADGRTITLRSPFALPRPSIDGEMATYAEVLPGVDLVVKSSNVGFSHNWVVKNREAAQDPRVRNLSLPLDIDGLSARKVDGGIEYLDPYGVRQFWTPTPMMWDSASEAAPGATGTDEPVRTSAEAVEDGPVQADRVSLVAATSDADSLDLKADRALLDDPDAVFPIVIDPPLTKTRNGWTAVWDNFPTKSFWNTDHTLGAGYEGYQQMKVVRSYFKFDTSALAGKYIATAELNVRQVHAASCSARATDVYRTAAISAATTWNKQPTRYALQSSNSSTAGCGSGTAMVGWNVLDGTRTIASTGTKNGTFMIRARSESDKIAWKQYDDAGANLAVNYISTPKVPVGLSIKTASKTYACGASTTSLPTIGATSVTIASTIETADTASSTDIYAVYRRRDMAAAADMADTAGTVLTSASKGVSQLSWGSIANKTLRYAVKTRARAVFNGTTYYADSAWNGTWCYFKTDTVSPPAPIVTPVSFVECASPEDPDQCTAQGTTHVAGTVNVKGGNTDATSYTVRLNNQPAQTIATAAGAQKTVTLVPDRPVNVLEVQSTDAAGNLSLKETFVFRVSKRQPEVRWTFDDPQALDVNAGTDSTAMILTSGTIPKADGRVLGSIANSGATVPTYVGTVPTTGDFTVAGWFHTDVNQSSTFASARATTEDSHAFELGYDAASSSWTAGRRNLAGVFTGATTPTAVWGAWTHLAASYQASTNKITLFVNGVARATATYPSAAVPTNKWQLACGSIAGSNFRCMNGRLDDVQLYAAQLSSDEVLDLANPVFADPSGTDNHPALSTAAFWGMDDAPWSVNAADGAFGADLALSDVHRDAAGTAQNAFVATALETGESVLSVPGVGSQQARVNHAVADSLGSFSVAARVRLADPTRSAVVAQQLGASGNAWTLGWEADAGGGGRWVFQRNSADGSAATSEVRTPLDVDPSSELTTIQAVYDARAGVIRIFDNGLVFEDEADPTTEALHDLPFTTAWQARSWFQVGNGVLNGATSPFVGEIDFVDVKAGAFDTFTAYSYVQGAN